MGEWQKPIAVKMDAEMLRRVEALQEVFSPFPWNAGGRRSHAIRTCIWVSYRIFVEGHDLRTLRAFVRQIRRFQKKQADEGDFAGSQQIDGRQP
jgi:hypothetical protein